MHLRMSGLKGCCKKLSRKRRNVSTLIFIIKKGIMALLKKTLNSLIGRKELGFLNALKEETNKIPICYLAPGPLD